MEKEEWKPIEGYEGWYEVSSFGRVRSLDRMRTANIPNRGVHTFMKKGICKKQHYHRDGYPMITLCKNGERKTFLVHRLVACAFVPNPNNLYEVNHIDEIKTNNHASNLEWVTRMQNVHHGTGIERMKERTKNHLRPVVQMTMDGSYIKQWRCIIDASKALHIPYPGIVNACRGKYKSSHGYIWMYAEK